MGSVKYTVVISDHTLDLREDLGRFPTVIIEVDEDEFVLDVAERALSEHSADWTYSSYSFVTPPDEDGRRLQAPYLTEYVDDDGGVTWTGRGLKGVRIRHVVRAFDEGLFEGDPRVLLVAKQTGGDGVLPVWQDLIDTVIRLGELGGSLALLVKGFLGVLDAFRRQWELRGAMPDSFLELVLERDEWNHEKLAQFLKVPLATAVELLEELGYRQDVDTGLCRL